MRNAEGAPHFSTVSGSLNVRSCIFVNIFPKEVLTGKTILDLPTFGRHGYGTMFLQ